jgi:hypothetical protein
MADGASSTVVNAFLASLLNGTAFTNYGTTFVQLHTGAPGAAGTTTIAGNNTRQASGTFTAPSGGSSTNNAAITWTNVNTAETYSHVSIWSLVSGGTFLASGSITANPVAIGDTFTIPINDITVSMPVAA